MLSSLSRSLLLPSGGRRSAVLHFEQSMESHLSCRSSVVQLNIKAVDNSCAIAKTQAQIRPDVTLFGCGSLRARCRGSVSSQPLVCCPFARIGNIKHRGLGVVTDSRRYTKTLASTSNRPVASCMCWVSVWFSLLLHISLSAIRGNEHLVLNGQYHMPASRFPTRKNVIVAYVLLQSPDEALLDRWLRCCQEPLRELYN